MALALMAAVIGGAGILRGAATSGTTTAAAASSPAAGSYDASNPPQGVFDDEWSVVTIGGQKVGYAHEALRREGDRVYTETRMVMRIGREANVVAIDEEDKTEETVAGEPKAFHSDVTMAQQPVVVDGRGEGLVMNVTMESGGYKQAKVVTLPTGTVMTWGEERLTRLKGLKPGTHYEFPMYSPADDLLKPLPTKVDVGAKEQVAVGGKTVEATRVDERSEAGGNVLDTVVWVDDTGRTVKLELPLGGITAEITPTTQAEALADYLPADIFSA